MGRDEESEPSVAVQCIIMELVYQQTNIKPFIPSFHFPTLIPKYAMKEKEKQCINDDLLNGNACMMSVSNWSRGEV